MLLSALSLISLLSLAAADSLPWANANPFASAAAEAYAEALAEARAIAHPDPEAYALAASADDCATFGCHAACGYLILNGAACSLNTTDTYSGPFNTSCLCTEGSNFLSRYDSCMDCGWTLWKYYGPYVESALEACSTLSTEPTGTLRCSTTLTDSYSKDANAGCAYGGACSTDAADASVSAAGNSTVSASVSSIVSSTGTSSGPFSSASSSASSGSTSASTTETASKTSSESSSSASSTNGAQLMAAGSSIIGGFMLALLI